MIRPFTFVALLLAAASGLYLYQTKHRAEVLDAKIAQTLRQVAAARERTGMLTAEWAWLNEPERLAQLAAQHFAMQPLNPARYVAAAELGARLPLPAPPVALAAAPAEDAQPAEAGAPVRVAEAAPALPAAPAPVAKPIPVAAAHAPPPRPAPVRQVAAVRLAPAPASALSPAPESLLSPAPESVAAHPAARPAVFAPVLNAVAMPVPRAAPPAQPVVSRVGVVATQPAVPAVASALGGYGRASLAPPVPFNGN